MQVVDSQSSMLLSLRHLLDRRPGENETQAFLSFLLAYEQLVRTMPARDLQLMMDYMRIHYAWLISDPAPWLQAWNRGSRRHDPAWPPPPSDRSIRERLPLVRHLVGGPAPLRYDDFWTDTEPQQRTRYEGAMVAARVERARGRRRRRP